MTERRENIARALWEALPDCFGWFHAPWDDIPETTRERWRRLADAAIAADGLQARVLELAEEYERHAGLMRAQQESTGVVDVVERWRAFEDAAATLRRALDGADSGSATT